MMAAASKKGVLAIVRTFLPDKPRYATGVLAAVAIGVLLFGRALRGTGVAQASSGSVPVSVHIGNAAGLAESCKANNVSHIFLTVADIQAHESGKGSAGWHNLTPGIPSGGVQLDLLLTSEEIGDLDECILADVDGGTSGLPAGKFQQFKLSLLTNGVNSPGPAGNACQSQLGADVFNCIEFNDGTFQRLTVPGRALKIPSSLIAHGGLRISAGQGSVDLDIDIDACKSLVVRGHGGATTFELKPVLQAGEIGLKPVIAGNVVVGAEASGTVSAASPIAGVSGATVLLEQRGAPNFVEDTPTPGADATPSVDLESVAAVTQTDSNGHFVFCPVPQGIYDIVASSATMPSMANASDATITTNISVTQANGGPDGLVIPLLPGSSPAVALEAQLTTQSSASATPATIDFGAAQTVAAGVEAQIPLYSGTTSSPVTTTADSSGTVGPACSSTPACPAGTDCACVSLVAPEDNPVIGPAGGPYATPASSALYSVFGTASTCTPADLITGSEPAPLPTPTLSFVNCQ